MRKLRRALVRGRRAVYWQILDDILVLRDRFTPAETEVPVPHLVDEREMQAHLARLRDKRWVSPAAIDELCEIAVGARG